VPLTLTLSQRERGLYYALSLWERAGVRGVRQKTQINW